MSVLDTAKSVASHRGMSCLELHRLLGGLQRKVHRLTERAEQATAMAGRIDEQAQTINSLREQRDAARRIRDEVNEKANRYDEAETRAQTAGQMLADQTAELLELRAFKANVTSVSSLPTPAAPAVPTQARACHRCSEWGGGVMTILTETLHIATCNVCGAKFDEPNGDWRWDGSPEAALDQIRCDEPGTDWRIVGADTVVCPTSDHRHDQVRGAASPAAKPGPAAVTVRLGDLDWLDDPNWVADRLGATVIAEEAA